MVSYPFTFPFTAYLFTYLLPAYLPGQLPIYVPTRPHAHQSIQVGAWERECTHPMSLCRHARSHPPNNFSKLLIVPNFLLTLVPVHLFSSSSRQKSPQLWKGADKLSLLICKVRWAISQCLYLSPAKKWSLSHENMPARENMPYCCPEDMSPPCNRTRNTLCCSENMQLALKLCLFSLQRNISPFISLGSILSKEGENAKVTIAYLEMWRGLHLLHHKEVLFTAHCCQL